MTRGVNSPREKLAMIQAVTGLEEAGLSLVKACRKVGVKPGNVSRWRVQYADGGLEALADGKSTGRPAVCEWPAEDVQAIREVYLRTNRGDGLASMSHAVRRCVFENRLSEDTQTVLSQSRHSKHYIPASLRRELRIAPGVIRHHRSPKNATLSGVYIPGGTRLASCGERRLFAGERFSVDDGSQNQVVVVPWPYGGSKEADKYGHRTCRGQWLVVHDDATGVIVAWMFTMRPRDSYRDADALSIVYRAGRDVCAPSQMVVEGGVWQSKRAKAFYQASGIEPLNAKGRPHLKLIENWFGRAWTFLSVFADGQIGRFRGEYQRENELLMKARAGSIDARQYFPMLPDLLREFDSCVEFLDQDPIESREYGSWVPKERWAQDMAERARECLDESLAPYAAPESSDVKVRRGGMVVCKTTCPLGIRMPYSFAHEDLAALEGRKVRVLYDPFETEIRAAIFDHKTNKPICVATCLNPPPAPVAEMDYRIMRDYAATAGAVHMKKAMANAVRSEYRALGSGGRKRISEQRGPEGVTRMEQDLTRGGCGPGSNETPPDLAVRRASSRWSAPVLDEAASDRISAEADALEAKLLERGDLITVPSGNG